MVEGLQVMADPMAGLRLPTAAEEQRHLTVAVAVAVDTRLRAVEEATAAAEAAEVTVAAGVTEPYSHRTFKQRRLRAALVFSGATAISSSQALQRREHRQFKL